MITEVCSTFLLQRLVDMLEEKLHLPAVLQSLGCIAQTAMPVFETREAEILEFLKTKIMNCSSVWKMLITFGVA